MKKIWAFLWPDAMAPLEKYAAYIALIGIGIAIHEIREVEGVSKDTQDIVASIGTKEEDDFPKAVLAITESINKAKDSAIIICSRISIDCLTDPDRSKKYVNALESKIRDNGKFVLKIYRATPEGRRNLFMKKYGVDTVTWNDEKLFRDSFLTKKVNGIPAPERIKSFCINSLGDTSEAANIISYCSLFKKMERAEEICFSRLIHDMNVNNLSSKSQNQICVSNRENEIRFSFWIFENHTVTYSFYNYDGENNKIQTYTSGVPAIFEFARSFLTNLEVMGRAKKT